MKLQLKNIGPLKEANIDLSKKMLVFCGRNNTGKTYAAYSIFGLYKFSKSYLGPILDIKIEDLIASGYSEIDLKKLLIEKYSRIFKTVGDVAKETLPNVFATDERFFNQSEFNLLSIDDFEPILNSLRERELAFGVSYAKAIDIDFAKEKYTDILKITLTESRDLSDKHHHANIKEIIEDQILDFIISILFNPVYISPAERSAINIFSKELSVRRNSLVDELLEMKDGKKMGDNPFNLLNRRAKRYPLPIRESLEIAEDLLTLQRGNSKYAFFADKIESEILKGKIKVSKDTGEVQFSPEKGKVKNLTIHLTASVVKSLSNLVFYFRHLAIENDFIIIDEPELNLHPDNQRKIAKLLAEIVNHGFKVLISTHSDYIIREINNLIMLKSDSPKALELRDKYGYEAGQLLNYSQIGAYIFDNSNNKSIELSVSATGFDVDTIDEEINQQNEAAQDIYLSLH